MVVGKVLVVDDARAVVDSMTDALGRLGVNLEDVLIATNAKDALARFHKHEPRLVFMDIDLGLDAGDAVARQILAAAPSTRVVVMTGLNPDEPRIRSVVSAGAYEVLQKPLRLQRLRQLLELIETEDRGLRRL